MLKALAIFMTLKAVANVTKNGKALALKKKISFKR
jgi:hypothetical protein